jgi:lysophospholipase L1-like esterase
MRCPRRFRPEVDALEARVALSADTGNRPVADAQSVLQGVPATIVPTTRRVASVWLGGARGRVSWMRIHRGFLRRLADPRGTPDVVFFGDSLTYDWGGTGRRSWATRLARFHAVNFGIAGEGTQHLLWRLEHGELASQPRVAVVMIGINNLRWGDSAQDTIAGVRAVVRTIQQRSPTTHVVLLGLLPTLDTDRSVPVARVNARLARAGLGPGVTYLGLAWRFRQTDGQPDPALYRDRVHLSKCGYARLVAPIAAVLRRLATETSKAMSPFNLPPRPASSLRAGTSG